MKKKFLLEILKTENDCIEVSQIESRALKSKFKKRYFLFLILFWFFAFSFLLFGFVIRPGLFRGYHFLFIYLNMPFFFEPTLKNSKANCWFSLLLSLLLLLDP